MRMLTTTEAVIDALGGLPKVMELTGATYRRAFNWKTADTFPSNTYAVMTEALRKVGCEAPKSLWSMIERQVEVSAG